MVTLQTSHPLTVVLCLSDVHALTILFLLILIVVLVLFILFVFIIINNSGTLLASIDPDAQALEGGLTDTRAPAVRELNALLVGPVECALTSALVDFPFEGSHVVVCW